MRSSGAIWRAIACASPSLAMMYGSAATVSTDSESASGTPLVSVISPRCAGTVSEWTCSA
jgi:hypothetical protein